MLAFTEYNTPITLEEKILVAASLADDDLLISESLHEGIAHKLHSAGLHVSKSRGLIDYVRIFTKGAGKLLGAAIKKDKKAVEELMDQIDKGDFIDFLIKLDMATLHLFTGPIHFIEAVTGWHIGAAVSSKMEKGAKLVDEIKKIIHQLKAKIEAGFKDKKLSKKIDEIEAALPLA